MIKVYFVRHAQAEHGWEDDRTRRLTTEGENDTGVVLEFLRHKKIDKFYSSPYKRSIDTIKGTAQYHEKEIILNVDFREREKGSNGNNQGMFQKRWQNLNFHEEGGESILMVQKRNIAALEDILSEHEITFREKDFNIVIGTHGTALSSVLNYFDASYDCDAFLRIIDWMPYIIELDFECGQLVNTIEHLHIHKEFKGV